jgi:hypothetical protein
MIKKFTCLSLFAILAAGFDASAQSLAKNTPTNSICGCPGEPWNLTQAYKPWVYFPSATNSKRLMHTNYDFNIPATANITGVKVEFGYTAINTPANSLKDSLCNLLINGGVSGQDKSGTTGYYGTAGNISFGGPGDTWGLGLTPADVNAPGFGFNFKMFSSVTGPQLTFDNGVTITIFYNTAAGISESQKSSPGLKAYYHNKVLKIETDDAEKTDVEIYDLTGKRISKSLLEGAGKHSVDLSLLDKGIYMYSVKSAAKSKVAKFIVE